jgi:transitional endoplasmic reticulum ATPase
MTMRLKEFANKYALSLENLQYFIHDFGIDLNFTLKDQLMVSEGFEAFVQKHLEFIKRYTEDRGKLKSIVQIAETIGLPKAQVEEFFLKNGVNAEDLPQLRTNLSSFLVHMFIGGDYSFILNDIPEHRFTTDALIGYSDLFFYQLDLLEPFLNEEQIKLWGISKPAGIILYGPPGSGKIYWAKRIAQLIGYEFVHVYKEFLLQGQHTRQQAFARFLKQQMEKPKTLLFIERFDELWQEKDPITSDSEHIALVSSILRLIQKDDKQEIVLVGAVENLGSLSDELTAPGRFDLQIPIFPPLAEERAQLIHYHLQHNLLEESPLKSILKGNQADHPEHWAAVANEMKLFSNTMIIDFTQSLKKRLYAQYRRKHANEITLSPELIKACLNEARAKLTGDYLRKCYQFIQDAKQNVAMEFPQRFMQMEFELEAYAPKATPFPKIGFETNAERQKAKQDGDINNGA